VNPISRVQDITPACHSHHSSSSSTPEQAVATAIAMTADSSVADVYQSLKASLDMFKIAAPENVDVPSKQVLVQAAEQVKNDAAKSERQLY
jgi:hypothetical protein